MRILFITATRLGDAVISTGLLEHLRHTCPEARFTIACGPVAAGLFQRMPGLERVIVMTKRRYDLHWFDLWRHCVLTRWDLVIDLRGSATSLFLWTRRRRIMRGGRRPGSRLAHVAQLFSLSPSPMPTVWTSPDDTARARATLGTLPLIALGPTANWSGKVWPADRFVALWNALSKTRPDIRLAVFYGPGQTEKHMAAPLLAIPGAIDAGGRFTLAETAAMLELCSLFVGNDSGLMHLAAAAGTPTLGLFGPSKASEYAPGGRRAEWIAAPGPEGEAPIAGLKTETVIEHARIMLPGAATETRQ
ncbi:glycosyltransferase family 9 protein [Acetobacter fallax]|uniref:Glycosyltransferase family 9 protein n=1 Tax=Acetobacter fallax TaxID=1737473 RepID=A0ABX0K8L1_9PROT|nr:glycosyltransferase family 9 protein [Acetobacter fallax]NHO31769.1 glycosyltransferase family 9 protein [Acetobacter fallax]NHO35328.1 glycosyltransferase family 9 protein [Acetobacter fallax]